jgi:hypothetical protein
MNSSRIPSLQHKEQYCPEISYLREALNIPAMKSPGKPGIAEAISMR